VSDLGFCCCCKIAMCILHHYTGYESVADAYPLAWHWSQFALFLNAH
jgi:hypothetical protein